MSGPTNDFYGLFAPLYASVADDRDFRAELGAMGVMELNPSACFVELFAGPAFHSRALQASGFDGSIIAIDCSPDMREVAARAGFRGQYLCADAIEGLTNVETADLICIPRYSIVLVEDEYLARLLREASRRLTASGMLFIEIHKDSVVNADTPVGGDWQSLEIHKRIKDIEGGKAECLWPFSTKVIDEARSIVDMSVKVFVVMDDGRREEHEFFSREHLHSRSRLNELAREADLCPIPSRCFDTPSGHYVAFGSAMMADLWAVRSACAGAATPFDLGSIAGRTALLDRSGVDPEAHDSPLSLHVYNLL